MRHFADIVEGKSAPLVSYADGMAALVLAEAALESAQAEKVVPLAR